MKVPAFADIGKQAADLLCGTKSVGVFQYDQKVTVNVKSAEGVVATAKAVKAGDDVTTDLKLVYSKVFGNNLVTLEGQPALKQMQCTVANTVLDGFKVTLAAQAPGTAKAVKMTVDYAQPHVTTKVSALVAKQPVFDVSAATGYNGFVLGGAAAVDPTNSSVNAARLAAAYMGKDFVLSAHTDPKFSAVRGTYWQQVDAASSIAAEVTHDVGSEASKARLAMGYAHVSYTGTLYKVKLSNDGKMHLHMESKLRPDTTAALSACVNALDVNQDPKVGLAIDHSP